MPLCHYDIMSFCHGTLTFLPGTLSVCLISTSIPLLPPLCNACNGGVARESGKEVREGEGGERGGGRKGKGEGQEEFKINRAFIKVQCCMFEHTNCFIR